MRYCAVMVTVLGLSIISTLMLPIDWHSDLPRSPGLPAPAWLLSRAHCYSLTFTPTDWVRPSPPIAVKLRAEPGMMFRHPVGPLLYRAVRLPPVARDEGWWRYVGQDSLDVVLTNEQDEYFLFMLRMSIRATTWRGRALTYGHAGHATVTAKPVTCPPADD